MNTFRWFVSLCASSLLACHGTTGDSPSQRPKAPTEAPRPPESRSEPEAAVDAYTRWALEFVRTHQASRGELARLLGAGQPTKEQCAAFFDSTRPPSGCDRARYGNQCPQPGPARNVGPLVSVPSDQAEHLEGQMAARRVWLYRGCRSPRRAAPRP
jgi:hypothetical protein